MNIRLLELDEPNIFGFFKYATFLDLFSLQISFNK